MIAQEMLPQAADMLGSWQITRRIDDRLSGRPGDFTGTARFDPAPDGGLIYAEQGTLRIADGAPMRAERRYLWRFQAGSIQVLFEDGRDFHSIHPGTAPQAEHLCGADLYAVRYRFDLPLAWHSGWTVRGPRKDYRMESVYFRA